MEFAAFRTHTNISKEEAGFLLLIFTLPLYRGFFGIAVVWILFYTLQRVLKEKSIRNFRIDWFLPALAFYFLISGLATGESLTSMEKRLPLLAMPLVFALNRTFLRLDLRNTVLTTFVLGNILAVGICLTRAIVRSVSFKDGQWDFNSKVYPDQTYDILTSSVMGGNYFFGSEFSFFFDQVTYFGIYIVIGQVFAYFLFQSTHCRRRRAALVIVYLLFAVVLFLLSSKAALLTSFLFTFYILLSMPAASWLKLMMVAIFLFGSLLSFTTNPRSKVFLESFVDSIQKIDPNAKYGHPLRILSWDAAVSVIKEHWLSGVGEGKKQTALIEMYEKKGYIFPAERLYNTHNQYLDFLLGGGVILLSFFFLGMAGYFIRAIRHRNRLLLFFLGIISFNLLFENLLSRHAGIVIFSTFMGYLSGLKDGGHAQKKSRDFDTINHSRP